MATPSPEREAERARALELLRRHGRDASSFQLLEPATRYWFDPVADGFVGYIETGLARVAGGAPVAPAAEISAVASRFVEAARRQRRRASFFAAEQGFVDASGYEHLLIGEQPTWDPRRWEELLAGSSSLRAQVRRAANKGVTARVASAAEVAEGGALRPQLDGIVQGWLRQKPMAPMGFLVDVRPFSFAEERIYVVALQDERVVAFLAAVPIYARDAWLFEDLLRLPGAPNGTTEALLDLGMRTAAARGARLVTLGLAPLSGDVPHGLAWARELAGPLYDFAGVHAFKARLRPHAWEPVYLAVPPGRWLWVGVVDALRAFARGSFLSFGLRTLVRGPPFVLWGLILALIAWIPLLAIAPTRWFPAPWIQQAWVGFDVLLCLLLVRLTRRYQPMLARFALVLVSLDAALTLAEALLWNLPRLDGMGEVAGLLVACTGPALGALALRGLIRGRAEFASPGQAPPGMLL